MALSLNVVGCALTMLAEIWTRGLVFHGSPVGYRQAKVKLAMSLSTLS